MVTRFILCLLFSTTLLHAGDRRVRHLPFSLGSGTGGAKLVLFAPAMRGYADGDPVSSWDGVGAATIDATASGSYRPSFTSQGINGEPAVSFTGGIRYMGLGGIWSGSEWTMLFLIKPATTSPRGLFDTAPVSAGTFRNYSSGWDWFDRDPILAQPALPDTSPIVMTVTTQLNPGRNISYSVNGGTAITAISSTTTPITWAAPIIGDINIYYGDAVYDGYLGAVVLIPSVVGDSLAARARQSLGFSFKISTH